MQRWNGIADANNRIIRRAAGKSQQRAVEMIDESLHERSRGIKKYGLDGHAILKEESALYARLFLQPGYLPYNLNRCKARTRS